MTRTIQRRSFSNTVRFAGLSLGLFLVAGTLAGCTHKSADSYIESGDQARQSAQLAQAEVDYLAAIKAAPEDARPHIVLGNLYAFEKKFDAARAEFVKAIELAPKDPVAHAAVGNAYAEQGQYGPAENQLRAAVALQPADGGYRLALGEVLAKEQKNAPAEDELRTAVGLDPKNAHTHLALANLLGTEPNRQDEAQAELAEVRALDPTLLPAAPTSAGAAASPAASPAMSPGGAPTPATASGAPRPRAKVKDIDKRFQLTHDSPVYENPDASSRVVAQVHRGKFVHITGITGDWFRIQLKTGVVGFIPLTAAE